jgi:hypothetical protein
MSKRIIITEEEKNEIKSLYNINEQGAGDILKGLADTIVNMIKTGKFGDDDNDENENSYLNDTNSGSVDSKWSKVTKKVINEFEGGYWNPKCGHQTAGMGKSTETMFGLDRYNGDIEKTPEGKEFFRLIDNEKNNKGMEQFCKKWKWNYKGGELEDKLKNLASKIMKHHYDNNSKNYFSPELKERVESNDRLLMHFAYATWNGSGFFKKFAKSLEDGIKSGKSDSELVKQAISDRKNTSLLNQDKVASIMTSSGLDFA